MRFKQMVIRCEIKTCAYVCGLNESTCVHENKYETRTCDGVRVT